MTSEQIKQMRLYLQGKQPPNLHLTFSRKEDNWHECEEVLDSGGNVAAVFGVLKGEDMPDTYKGFPVIDADETDLRFLDLQGGYICGLRLKGRRQCIERDRMILTGMAIPGSTVLEDFQNRRTNRWKTLTIWTSKKNIDKFRCRELSRFRTGEYQRCIELLDDPEFREAYESECQRTGVPHYMLHYLHWSVKDPEMVAYTPSIEYGIRDRQVRVRLGRYLSKHFGHVLSEKKRLELVEKHNATALANCKFRHRHDARSHRDCVHLAARHPA